MRFIFILIFLAFNSYINNTYGESITIEAEDCTLSGTLTIEKTTSGYSGTGYVSRFENSTDFLTTSVEIDTEGPYNVYIGYAAPYGEKKNYVSINGNSTEVNFPVSYSFKEASVGKINFQKGANEIKISSSWGWILVDYIRIEPNTDPEVTFNISGNLVTPNASNETYALYQFLQDNFGKKIISGVMTLNSLDEATWLKETFNKEPALLGIDFMHCNRGYTWYNNEAPVNDAKLWYSKNGIPAMMWHWRDPSRITEEFYTSNTSFDVSKINDPNSAEYTAMLNDIDFIAGELLKLKNQNVPILWRPLHEASGTWFWWGAKGPEPAKVLWKLMFDRLTTYHKLDNLIWVWTTDSNSDNMDWYPGDEYVDILGVDIYAETGDYSSQVLMFEKIKSDFQGKKIISLSENGVIPDPDNLDNDNAGWSYFMPWYGDFVRDGFSNPISHWQKVLNHEYVITLDEMPDLSTYSSTNSFIRTLKESNFKVCVNQNQLNITTKNIENKYDVYLYSIGGKLCVEQLNNTANSVIDLACLQTGIYITKVITNDKQESFKIIKH